MAKQQTNPPFNQDEFQRIFDEYRSKIEEITRSTGRSMEALRVPPMEETSEEIAPEEEAVENADEAEIEEKKPDRSGPPQPPYTGMSRPAAPDRDYEAQFQPESKKIINDARKQAKHILEEAEKEARKEARKQTKSQAEKILARARQDAETYAEKARQSIEQERASAIDVARTQAEQSLKEMTEYFRRQAHEKSIQLVAEAQARADRLMREVTDASAEISRKVNEVIDRSRVTINEFEERLKSETDDISQAIVDTQSRIEALAMAAAEEAARTAPAPPARSEEEPAGVPTMLVRVLGERSNGRKGTQPLFFGMVEVNAPPETCDFRYFKGMKRYMLSVPGIKQLQESASEKELSVLFDITEPLPLLELFSKIPQVEEVVSRSDRDIAVVFRR